MARQKVTHPWIRTPADGRKPRPASRIGRLSAALRSWHALCFCSSQADAFRARHVPRNCTAMRLTSSRRLLLLVILMAAAPLFA
jgi:hypothetical protein